MSEEAKADVEMAPATEETPQKLPVPKESDLPIEDIDDIDEFEDEIENTAKKTSIMIDNHASILVQNMEKLKNDKDTCDVILRVKKGNYYWASFWAHKSVLAANSPVFAEALKKFTTYGLPAVETVCRPNLVLPRKIHGAALAALVDWMYTGKLTVHRKALGHLPLVAYYLKVQPLIEKLEEIFGDFKESGVSLIDEKVEVEAVGAENDDNEDEKKEEAKDKKSDDNGAEEEAKSEEKMDVDSEDKKQKEWVVNLWIKRKWADELPKVKPIPGFYIMLQSDSHRVKSSRGRKGQDPFDPPESVLDTNWLAAYNQFKAKQLVNKKTGYQGRGGRGGPPRGRGRGFPPARGGWNGPPRGGGYRGRGGPYNYGSQGYNQPPNQGWNQGWGGGGRGGGWAPPRGGGGWRGGGGPHRGGGGRGGGGWRGPPRGGRGGGRGRGRGRGRPGPY